MTSRWSDYMLYSKEIWSSWEFRPSGLFILVKGGDMVVTDLVGVCRSCQIYLDWRDGKRMIIVS